LVCLLKVKFSIFLYSINHKIAFSPLCIPSHLQSNRHSAGTYDAETDTGGSNGAGMRYEAEGGDPANAGLQHARVFLEAVKEKHSWITYADLWTLAGVVAIEEMGGPLIPWEGGRTDYVDDSKLPPRGRLPDGAQGSDHLRWIFYRMGFNDQEIVALSGAHNLGRCHSDRSGFEGAWVNNPTRFSNQYFRLLLSLQWKKKMLKNGVEQFVNYDENTEAELVMLPTDIALTQDLKFRKWVELYACDKDRFFEDFSKVFAKLVELDIQRDEKGEVTNTDNEKGGYHSAPKKKATAGNPAKSTDDNVEPSDGEHLNMENEKFWARL
jgi:peroxiredoxin